MALEITAAPLVPVRHAIEYATSVAAGAGGREYRTTRSHGRPRQSVQYRYDLEDAETAVLSLANRNTQLDEVAVPIWWEAVDLTVATHGHNAVERVSAIDGSIAPGGGPGFAAIHNLLRAGDRVFVNGQPAQLTSALPTRIRFAGAVEIPATGTVSIAPMTTLQRFTGGSVDHHVVNGGVLTLEGVATGFDTLRSRSAFTDLDVFPLLDRRPVHAGTYATVFDQSLEITDDNIGGIFKVRSELPESRTIRNLNFVADSRDEWDKWKGFMTRIQGQQTEFMMPTYTRDLEPVSYSGTLLVVRNMEISATRRLGDIWKSGQYLRLEYESGASHIVQVEQVESAPAELSLRLTSATQTASPLDKISLVELVRLASDTIVIEHSSAHSVIGMAVRSVVTDGIPVQEISGAFDTGFAGGYEI